MSNVTPQQQLQDALHQVGIPAKEIKVYGSQVMITAYSETAARQWARTLQRFCSSTRGPVRSAEYNKVNRGSNLNPTTYAVWLIGGTI